MKEKIINERINPRHILSKIFKNFRIVYSFLKQVEIISCKHFCDFRSNGHHYRVFVLMRRLLCWSVNTVILCTIILHFIGLTLFHLCLSVTVFFLVFFPLKTLKYPDLNISQKKKRLSLTICFRAWEDAQFPAEGFISTCVIDFFCLISPAGTHFCVLFTALQSGVSLACWIK